ncbi:MAG: hypothetical protein ACFHVJ_10895 [Aestuariibacter sp.]
MKALKTTLLSTLVAASLSVSVSAKELSVLVDVSQSNPMLVDTAFNKRAAEFVISEVQSLKKGDTVTIQTFGTLQDSENLTVQTLQVSRHNQKKVAAAVAKYLLSLPELIKPQGSTNLLAWFNRNPQNCDQQPEKILILSDAIEASEYVNPNLLLSGKQSLPVPSEYVNINGCDVVMFGIGSGRMDQETTRLRKAWEQYFEHADARFTAVPL